MVHKTARICIQVCICTYDVDTYIYSTSYVCIRRTKEDQGPAKTTNKPPSDGWWITLTTSRQGFCHHPCPFMFSSLASPFPSQAHEKYRARQRSVPSSSMRIVVRCTRDVVSLLVFRLCRDLWISPSAWLGSPACDERHAMASPCVAWTLEPLAHGSIGHTSSTTSSIPASPSAPSPSWACTYTCRSRPASTTAARRR